MKQKIVLHLQLYIATVAVGLLIRYTIYPPLLDLFEALFYQIPWRH